MEWLKHLALTPSPAAATAHDALILALVAALGLAFGRIAIFGVRLGVAGVMFVGIAFGHYGLTIDHTVLEFARDFGLLLFVYTVGLQIGPGFGASLRRQGLPLNLMAAGIVLIGAALTVVLTRTLLPRADFPAMVGVFSGATTNTPSLAAAQQILSALQPSAARLPPLGYAVAYPMGIVGIILSMLLVRGVFRVNLSHEAEALTSAMGSDDKLEAVDVRVTNASVRGLPLKSVLTSSRGEVVVSRFQHHEEMRVATGEEELEQGDLLHAVGPTAAVEDLLHRVGQPYEGDLIHRGSSIQFRHLLVTQNSALGKSVPDLRLTERCRVVGTRVLRGDVELPADHAIKLTFGDRVRAVGTEADLAQAAQILGDSVEVRDRPLMIPMFLGLTAGVLLGSIPIPLPGFPVPVMLGLAGGPLVAAIVLGRLGKLGPLVWYMPRSANLLVREIGIVLFLACVGIKAGGNFVETLVHGHGFIWMGCGALITLIPLLTMAFFARLARQMNYMPLCGLLAGSMTDPPALAFAGQITGSEAPSVAYAAVYPLVMLLRILIVQALLLFFR